MELDSERFKSEVGVEVVRGVGGLGSKRLELRAEEFGSRGRVGIGEVGGLGCGVGFGKLGLGGQEGLGSGELGLEKLGSEDLGSKESRSGG